MKEEPAEQDEQIDPYIELKKDPYWWKEEPTEDPCIVEISDSDDQ